jgi:hypothetical protein
MLKRTNKYNAKKFISSDGTKYDSKREYFRHLELLEMETNGVISELNRQVEFTLLPAVKVTETVQLKTKSKEVTKTIQQPIKYVADFVYTENGEKVVEDVKISPKVLPKDYVLKKKLLFYFYKYKIREYYGEKK